MPDIAYGQIWRIDGNGWVAMVIHGYPGIDLWECLVIYDAVLPGAGNILSYNLRNNWVREA